MRERSFQAEAPAYVRRDYRCHLRLRSRSRFDVSRRNVGRRRFNPRQPLRRRAFVVPWPDLRHAARPRRTLPDRTISFTRTCVWYARLRHGCAHVRLIRLDVRALSLYRARLPRQRWITRDGVYSFPSTIVKRNNARTDGNMTTLYVFTHYSLFLLIISFFLREIFSNYRLSQSQIFNILICRTTMIDLATIIKILMITCKSNN